VVELLDQIIVERGEPQFVRFDNGPEFTANAVVKWCANKTTNTNFIEPGSPWQNAYIESCRGHSKPVLLRETVDIQFVLVGLGVVVQRQEFNVACNLRWRVYRRCGGSPGRSHRPVHAWLLRYSKLALSGLANKSHKPESSLNQMSE